MTKRPNFLFIITDQQRADWLGCYGHPVLKTPNIDSIAARGTVFENFHVASPVCMPNRASLLTGRYPSLHGLRYNGCALPTDANTFVNVLADAGYHTAAIGKSHLQPFTAMAPMGKTAEEIGRMPEAWEIVRDLIQALGGGNGIYAATELFAQLAGEVPEFEGITFGQIGDLGLPLIETDERIPLLEREAERKAQGLIVG